MNRYELAVLYHPDLEIDLEKSETKVTKIIADNGGKVVDKESWGKRKTAYKIKGHEHAVYVFYTFEVDGPAVQKIEAALNITDEVIRFLIVKEDEKAVAKAAEFKAKRKTQESEEEQKEVSEEGEK